MQALHPHTGDRPPLLQCGGDALNDEDGVVSNMRKVAVNSVSPVFQFLPADFRNSGDRISAWCLFHW